MTISALAGSGVLDDLRVGSRKNPLGIGLEKPVLSWKMNDMRQGAAQKAYQVQVASTTATLLSGKADIWDSGRKEGDASIEIPYGGPDLKPMTNYVWHVRAWDMNNQPLDYSAPASFETGIADGAWKARWIGSKNTDQVIGSDVKGADWIWVPGDGAPQKAAAGKFYFRQDINVPTDKPIKSAEVWALGDNHFDAFINGESVTNGSSWKVITPVDATSFIKPGKNQLGVQVNNNKKGPGGMAFSLRITFADNSAMNVFSDGKWTAKKSAKDGWTTAVANAKGWKTARVLGPIGIKPWDIPEPFKKGGAATLLRKSFQTKPDIESARLYITALGSYRASINGQRVGNDILTPNWTDYTKRVRYQTYDVTPLVKSGENAIGVILGDGWYGSGLGWTLQRFSFGDPPTRLLAELHVRYKDGSETVVPSDASWKADTSAIERSEIYAGETYDSTKVQAGWDQAGFNDSKWTSALTPETSSTIKVQPEIAQPIRITQEVKPIGITNPEKGTYVFDMGQNMVGWARLKVSGKAGDRVRLRFAEILKPDGNIYTENLRRAEATDTYTLHGGGVETWEPHFTYHGFRYVEVTGYPGTPDLSAITGRVFHTDAPFIGTFKCSDPMVNKIAENTIWGLKGNLMSVPTDCPQRDERLGWMGDAQAIWSTACFNMDLQAFTDKWTQDIEDAQSTAGAYSNVTPRVISVNDGAPAWGDAGIIVPYAAWRKFGDTDLIRSHWKSMEGWLAFIGKANPNFLWLNERGSDYGDWVPANSETDKSMIATAYWAYDARLMVEMAKALGDSEGATKYQHLYDNVKKAFIEKFIKPDGTVANGSQTCYVLALYNDLVPYDRKTSAVNLLVADIKSRDNHLSTGFLGSTYLMDVLSDNGHHELATTLLLNKTYPSWGYMVVKGATTIWERWNGDKGDPSMNSYNHYCYGAVDGWMYSHLAGLEATTPGFKTFDVHPRFDPRLTSVNCTYDSSYGKIESSYKINGSTINVKVTVPANTTGRLILPGDASAIKTGGKSMIEAGMKTTGAEEGSTAVELPAGRYEFSTTLK